MKACEKYAAALSAFADGELNETEKEELLDHVEQCEACREQLSELMILHAMFEELPELDAPDGFAERVLARVHEDASAAKKPRRRALRTLAACAALVLIAGAAWTLPGGKFFGAASDSAAMESADTNGAEQKVESSAAGDRGDEEIYDSLWSDSVQYDGSSYGLSAGNAPSESEKNEMAQDGAQYLNVRVDDSAAAEFLKMNGMSVYAETEESVSFLVTPVIARALAGESIVTAAEAGVLNGATELVIVEVSKAEADSELSLPMGSEAEDSSAGSADTAPEEPAEGAALPAESEVAE